MEDQRGTRVSAVYVAPRSAVMCLRGSRSSRGRPAHPVVGEGDIELALIEGRVGQ